MLAAPLLAWQDQQVNKFRALGTRKVGAGVSG